MQRNILKIALVCSMAIFLAATPVLPLNAADTAIDTGAQDTDTPELRETYYVTAQNGLKMRSAPSKDSDIITLLPYGAELTVIGTSNSGWYEVEYADDSGYVAAKYIAKSNETDSGSDNHATEDNESIPQTELTSEGIQASLGVTPIIIALIVAIIIMIFLAIFTACSFLKKERNNYDEEIDENDIDENHYDDQNEYYDENEESECTYDDYDDDEYYDDE